MKEKSMSKKYTNKEITWTEYNNWLIHKKLINIKSMYQKWKDGEISQKEYLNWWSQQNGYKDYSEYKRQWHKNNPEYNRQYYQENKEDMLKEVKQWYQDNKETKSTYRKKYYQEHKEQESEWTKHWRKENPENEKKWRRKYLKTPKGKLANKRQHSKWRELGYNLINIEDAYNSEYEGHHLNVDDVLFVPKKLHESIRHSLTKNKNMDKINFIAIQWYISHLKL